MEDQTATQESGADQGNAQPSGAQDDYSVFADAMTSSLTEQQAAEKGAQGNPLGQPEPGPAEQRVRVKVNGEEREVTMAELVERFQKEHSAEKRFEDAARIRREADTERVAASQERGQYQQQLAQFIEMAKAMMPAPPNTAMIDSDPVEFMRQREVYAQRQAQLQQALAAQAHLEQQQQAERAQGQHRSLMESQAELLKALPHWSDSGKAQAERVRIAEHMRSLGVPQERIDAISDHRDVIAYRESMLYRELLSKAKGAAKQLAGVPPKVERPGVAGGDATRGTSQAAMQRLRRSGSIDDAASVLNGLLN